MKIRLRIGKKNDTELSLKDLRRAARTLRIMIYTLPDGETQQGAFALFFLNGALALVNMLVDAGENAETRQSHLEKKEKWAHSLILRANEFREERTDVQDTGVGTVFLN